MKNMSLSIAVLLLVGCNSIQKDDPKKSVTIKKAQPTFFQYNIWGAFVNRVFDGSLKVSELKSKGDIGLGSFDFLDGELVMLDGIAYRIREDGTVSEGASNEEVVYADATFFNKEQEFSTKDAVNFDSLRKYINTYLPSLNNFYAFKISGEFDFIKVGGLHKQESPFNTGLDVLIPTRPVFTGEKIKGTIVGFYCPSFIGDINTAGYHFHFIADNKSIGGHVMELNASKPLLIGMQKMINYEFRLPESKEFQNVQLDKQFQYNKK